MCRKNLPKDTILMSCCHYPKLPSVGPEGRVVDFLGHGIHCVLFVVWLFGLFGFSVLIDKLGLGKPIPFPMMHLALIVCKSTPS